MNIPAQRPGGYRMTQFMRENCQNQEQPDEGKLEEQTSSQRTRMDLVQDECADSCHQNREQKP
jgi:hypothetical protein